LLQHLGLYNNWYLLLLLLLFPLFLDQSPLELVCTHEDMRCFYYFSFHSLTVPGVSRGLCLPAQILSDMPSPCLGPPNCSLKSQSSYAQRSCSLLLFFPSPLLYLSARLRRDFKWGLECSPLLSCQDGSGTFGALVVLAILSGSFPCPMGWLAKTFFIITFA
jgi:hypothetical protein